jgi:hypothetical protein
MATSSGDDAVDHDVDGEVEPLVMLGAFGGPLLCVSLSG